MRGRDNGRLFVCYVPSLDARRVDARRTPFLHELREKSPTVAISTLPSTELLPTLVTGVYPHEHEIWQVSLREDARWSDDAPRTHLRSFRDRVPDLLTTTLQCARHAVDPGYDLAAIPSRRRRQFELFRFKYTRRQKSDEPMRRFGPHESLFGILGSEARYSFTKSFNALDRLSRNLPDEARIFEFLEMYALDLCLHWNLDRPEVVDDAHRRTDRFLEQVHERCRRTGNRLCILVDHGHEPVVGSIPLRAALAKSAVPEQEYSYFIEVGQARFWFHTARAREVLMGTLRGLEHATLLSWKELHDHHVCFADDSRGEAYLLADAGWIFFPHDFFQPLANTLLALRDPLQRRRLFRPRHRGNHGYLPHFPSEKGWLLLADPTYRALRPEIPLIDFAPTALSLLGRGQPDYMKGTAAFAR